MTPFQRRGLVVLLLVGVMSAGEAYLRVSGEAEPSSERYATRIARDLGGWTCAQEWDGSADEIAILGTQDIMHRSYVSTRGEPFYLAVVRSENRRAGVHDPLTCFRAQGWETMRKQARALTLDDGTAVPVMELVISRDRQQRLVLFFFKTGPYFANDFWRQQAHVLYLQLFGKDEQQYASLLRMETPLRRNSLEQTRADLDAFALAVIPEILKHIP